MWDDNEDHSGWPLRKMFESIPFDDISKRRRFRHVTTTRKAIPPRTEQPGDVNNPRVMDDDGKLTDKLKDFASLMVAVDPSKTEQRHLFELVNTAHGRRLAEHLNNISKTERQLPMLDRTTETYLTDLAKAADGMATICKRIIDGQTEVSEHAFTAALNEHCKTHKVSFEKAFAEPTTRQAYAIVRDAGHVQSLGYAKSGPNMMIVTPVSVEVGSTNTADDSAKAYAQLQGLVAAQRKLAPTLTDSQLYEMVFSDNPALVKASVWHGAATGAFTGAKRPSSTSGSELQR